MPHLRQRRRGPGGTIEDMKVDSRGVAIGALVCALMTGSVQAQGAIAVTKNLGYLKRIDPITDINTSYIVIFEVNDTEGETRLRIRCDDAGKPNVWGSLATKNEILPEDPDDASTLIWPNVTVRLGTDSPFDFQAGELYSVTDTTKSIGFDGKSLDKVVAGLIAGKKLVIRLTGNQFRQPLTYTFSGQGFSTAWNSVKACK